MARRGRPTAPTGYSRVIRVGAEVFAEVKAQASGFETPNTLLRRALGLAPPDAGDLGDLDWSDSSTELHRGPRCSHARDARA